MSLTSLVTGKRISILDHNEFRQVANTLLTVEANLANVPLNDLDVSCRDNDPDGGIDARVFWPSGHAHDVLKSGENVLQYKSGKITLTDIRKEFNKPGVQKALKNGGAYALLVGHDYVKKDAQKRRKELLALCKTQKYKPDRCAIQFGSQIARWVAHHPSVIIMPELGLSLPPFLTVDRWMQQAELKNPWKPEPSRNEIIEKLRAFARRETDALTLRVEGPAGVGKTRVALEALQQRGLADSVIYAPDAEQQGVDALLTEIQADSQIQATIAVDECDSDRQELLSKFANLSQGRLRLVLIGPSEVLNASVSSSGVFVIRPLPENTIREALSESYGAWPREHIDLAVRLAGGYIKLAIFIGDKLSKDRNISPSELTQIHDIRQFLKRFVDDSTNRALQYASLLWRLGWEEDVEDEARAISTYFNLPFHEFQRGVKKLRDTGVIVPRGRYIYVSPDLLAISAAATLWDIHKTDLIDIVQVLPGGDSRRQLLRRLASIGYEPQVRKAVERLLGKDGLFKTLKDLDEEFRSEAFTMLASAAPDAAVVVLDRIIEKASKEDLLGFRVGRRNAVWAIESLLRWPATSLTAARSLRALALAENESIGNNATAIFCEYLHMFLSRSPISMIERLEELVDDLITTGSSSERLLAVKALGAAIEFNEFRMGDNIDRLSGKQFPSEWRPTTIEQLEEARRAVIERLRQIAGGDDEAASEAQERLIESAFVLVRDGLFELAVSALEAVSPRTDKEKRALLDACRRTERDAKDLLRDDQKNRLQAAGDRTFDQSYSGRLKRWVGPRLHTDFDLDAGSNGYAEADAMTTDLADEGYKSGIAESDLEWLATPNAENVWGFAFRLGQLDRESKFLERIQKVSGDDINVVPLAAYLNGRASVDGEGFREDYLDKLATSRPVVAFACTWRGASSNRGLHRILKLVEEGRIVPDLLTYLMFGGWTLTLSKKEVFALVAAMLQAKTHQIFDAAAGVLMNLLNRDPNALDVVEPHVWTLLEIKPQHNWEWDWKVLAHRMIDRDPERIVKIVLGFFAERHFVPIQSDETMQALRDATLKSPDKAWRSVGDALLKADDISMRLGISLKKWYGQLIPTETLIAWAKANRPRGPWIVAELIDAHQDPLPERARALILAFPRDTRIKSQIAGNLQTGMSFGPLSNRVSSDLDIVKGWARDPSPPIRKFARELERGIEARLRRQKRFEEEEEIG